MSTKPPSKRIYPEKHPNKKTRRAIQETKKGKTITAKNFNDLCNQLGI